MGGGGGGGKKGSGTVIGYKYSLGVHMILCCSPIDEIMEMQVGEKVAWTADNTTINLVHQTTTYKKNIWDAGGKYGGTFLEGYLFNSSGTKDSYSFGNILVGAVDANNSIFINMPDLFGGEQKEGGVVGWVDVMFGDANQAVNPYLQNQLSGTGNNTALIASYIQYIQRNVNPAFWANLIATYTASLTTALRPIPAYRGVVSVVLRKVYQCSIAPYPKPWAFKVKSIPGTEWYPATADINGGSANGIHIIWTCITNTDWGMGLDPNTIQDDDFRAAALTVYREGLGLSFLLTSTDTIESFIYTVMHHLNGVFFTRPDTGRFSVKLFRDNYNSSNLPVYNESNIVKLESFERPIPTEMVNEVTVVYRPRGTRKDDSVTVHNLAMIQAEQGIVSQTVHYPGIDNAANAQRVALRDLRQKCTPAAKVRFQVNRKAWNRTIGDVVAFQWAELGVANLVVRVLGLNYGAYDDSVILIDGIEDIFGLPNNTYLGEEPRVWVDPIHAAHSIEVRHIKEATYWEAYKTLPSSDFNSLNSIASYIYALGGKPDQASTGFELWSQPSGGTFIKANSGHFCAYCMLDADITELTTNITISEIIGSARYFNRGDFGYLGNEIIKIVDADNVNGTMTIARGCLDTVPASHTRYELIMFANGAQVYDPTKYFSGETIFTKLRNRTSIDLQDLSDAETDTNVVTGRIGRPYPPGNLRFNTVAYPAYITGANPTFQWSHRDKTQQLALIIDTTAGDIGPEFGVTYNLRIYNESGTLSKSVNLGANNYIWSTEVADSGIGRVNGQIKIELESTKQGLVSHQKHSVTVKRAGYGLHYGELYGV